MSYQLIYTSAPILLEPGCTGYGTVARSAGIPGGLAKRLSALSVYRENTGIDGAQYSYRILDVAGATYHVLTSTQCAGADYTGRECHISHHLALKSDEVKMLGSNAARPTPAGIILALKESNFWLSKWDAEPCLIESQPRLTATMLPEAAVQARWKLFTNHKGNARAFFTAPYERDCLVTVPQGMLTHDILLLINESDWLSSQRGWGKSFTTNGVQQDTFAETQRIVVTEGSSLEGRARRTGRPILAINKELNIAQGNASPQAETVKDKSMENFKEFLLDSNTDCGPPSAPYVPAISQKLLNAAAMPASHGMELPLGQHKQKTNYRYRETADEYCYPQAAQKSRPRKLLIGLALILLMLTPLFIQRYGHKDHEHSPTTQEQLETSVPLELFSKLLQKPFKQDACMAELERIEQLILHEINIKQYNPRETELLHDCVSILMFSSKAVEGHANNMLRLIQHAQQLDLPATELCRLYLHRSLTDRPLEAWLTQMTISEASSIYDLSLQENMQALFAEAPFSPYLQPLIEQANSLRKSGEHTAGIPTAPTKKQEDEQGVFVALKAGQAIPAELQKLLSSSPVEIQEGFISVIPAWGANYERELTQRHTNILIEKESDFQYNFIPLERGRRQTEPLFKLYASEEFRSFTFNSLPASMLLENKSAQGLMRFLLLPHYIFPVEARPGNYTPPAPATMDFQLSEADLIVQNKSQLFRGFGLSQGITLELHENFLSGFPWHPTHVNIPLLHDRSCVLPHFPCLGENLIMNEFSESTNSPDFPYTWESEPLPYQQDGVTAFALRLTRSYDFRGALHRAFYITANTSCCGEVPSGDPFYSLASLYSILQQMEECAADEMQGLVELYFKLYSNKRFANILSSIFVDESEMTLRSEQVESENSLNQEARLKLQQELQRPEKRALLRARLRETLQRSLASAYAKQYQLMDAQRSIPSLKLVLTRVEKVGEELHWFFKLQDATDK